MGIQKSDELIPEFNKRGFHYNKDLLFNYFNSLITKPFVILTGISGSGKSKIAEIFSEIISTDDEKQYELIPVKPNWRDSKGLFGYHNLIDNSYYVTPLIELFLKALKAPHIPYFLILDEMNIAKTEHYFADYLSLIESRRVEYQKCSTSLYDLKKIFRYEDKITLSEAIILASIDLNSPDEYLEVKKYRENRFVTLWREQFSQQNDDKSWTPQVRSELNQGDGRLAHRVFTGGGHGEYKGLYKRKLKSEISEEDLEIIIHLEKIYIEATNNNIITQDNMVLHNNEKCLSSNGTICPEENCPYKKNRKYECTKLYTKENNHCFVPPELPIPLNIFTIGTVNVDETTYMFSPKVLDRSNVIEFNEIDFNGLYNISDKNKEYLQTNNKSIIDDNFFFDNNSYIPQLKITMPSNTEVNKLIADENKCFDDIIKVFIALKKYNMHFGYRVINEISGYICNVCKNTSYEKKAVIALDYQILQKILPKFYGTYDKIWGPLVEILSCCMKKIINLDPNSDGDKIIAALNNSSNSEINNWEIETNIAIEIFKYPKTALKILEMLSDLDKVGFATFIK
ncbi:hypothetical protein EW093_17085 (plasmid) [Thiospirochaeta perfilievii]|uniref:ATPase dynein-related AAA domain-containing protein n=1 Tax=Thiospirochaeta perfilievii TaxID=252967 RepID=A0A5C1QED5_9SPIO|nr:hypothetical protein [Thiospirochaeta perfilievii]QEN06425.1 hypothetical protein EW093_17085 [Thiospirochaeta perfilievii]